MDPNQDQDSQEVAATDEYFEAQPPLPEPADDGPEGSIEPVGGLPRNYVREIQQEFQEQEEEGKL